MNADRNPRMYIVIERGGLRNAVSSEDRNKAILLDVTHADRQARVYIRDGSADRDGSAASTGAKAQPLRPCRIGVLRQAQP